MWNSIIFISLYLILLILSTIYDVGTDVYKVKVVSTLSVAGYRVSHTAQLGTGFFLSTVTGYRL